MELWELVARESIRDLVARYNANGDTGRFAQVLELFADDAVMELHDGVIYDGIERIESIFTGTQKTVKGLDTGGARVYMRHYTATLQIDLQDNTHAKGRCYSQVLMHHGLDHWGRYIDEYEQRDGRWLFTRRKVTLDGFVPGGMGEAGAASAAS
jgi:ketosteroid isomerase-like protein